MDNQVYSEDIYPLSKSGYMKKLIHSDEDQDTYEKIVSYVKRKARPASPPELIDMTREFFKNIGKEIKL